MYKIDSFMKLFAPFSVVVTLFKKYTIPLIQFDGFYLSIGNPRQRLAPTQRGRKWHREGVHRNGFQSKITKTINLTHLMAENMIRNRPSKKPETELAPG